eukprot:10776648-Ditylum_brightwellii.AAC.1
MENKKAMGPSRITSDALKSMVWNEENPDEDHDNDNDNYLTTIIHAMILEFWEGKLDFESWKSGTLAPVPKKSDLSNPNKWSPACLLETTYKTMATSIIVRRINPMIWDHRLELQCGGLNLKGCQDAMFLLKSALQICHEYNLPSHVIFVDLVKAFDLVNREFLWLVLGRYGIPHSIDNVIKCMYCGFSLKFTVGDATKDIPYTMGVHQGDDLAPLLFNIFFQAALDSLESTWEEN